MMSDPSKNKKRAAAKTVALVGIMAASIECAKLALSFLPNIEAVSLLVALYSYVFGGVGILAAVVFVAIEPLIWGVNTWVISYFIYWPLLALVFLMLGKKGIKNRFLIASVAVIMTFFFGIITSLVDVGLLVGYFDNFLYRFGVYYARGVVFYLLQIGTNAVLFTLVFPFLSKKLCLFRDK